QAAYVAQFSCPAIAGRNVEHTPVRIAAARRRIESDVVCWMDAVQQLNPHHLAGRALELLVFNVPVSPFDEHGLARDGGAAGWSEDRFGWGILRRVQSRNLGIVGRG